MRKLLLLVSLSILALSGCATVPVDDIDVTSDADPKANFSGYKTYAWLGSLAVLNDPQGMWKPKGFDIDSEVTFLINRELRKASIQETSVNPDLIVVYAMGVDMSALKEKMNPDTELKTIQNVPQGALVITLIDAETGFIIWAANATAEIKNLQPEQAKKRLDYAVKKMFSEFANK